jgi:hypothetical protein
MNYIAAYKITERKLSQQFISPSITSVSREGYEPWLRERAERLAGVANEFFAELSKAL